MKASFSQLLLLLALAFALTGWYAQTIRSQHKIRVTTKAAKPATKAGKVERLFKFFNRWQGSPYESGGLNRAGVDCSGLVIKAFRSKRLPRRAAQQARQGRAVSRAELKPGDLLFFATEEERPELVSHVGIFLHKDNFFHASSTRGVIMSNLGEPYYKKRFLFARRL